jgi:hypothetical protein
MPLLRRRGSLPNGDRRAEIVALDARAASDVVDADPELADALALLADARPEMPTAPVPPDTATLELTIEIRELDALDDEHPESFDAVVQVVVRDGHGMLHRVPAGTLTSADGLVVLPARFVLDDPVSVAPAAPLGVVSIELRSNLPSHRSRRVGIELVGLDAVSADDDRTPIDAGRWSFASSVVGSLEEPAAIAGASADSAAQAAAVVTTGRSQFGATATYAIQPVGDPVPDEVGVLVSRSWFDANERSLGDPVGLDALGRQDGRIVGVVDAFPTVVPADAFVVLVDLPTVAAASYEAGATLLTIDELWLSTDRPMLGALQAEPYEAVSVVERDELGADLLADPPAVGTIGSMTIGFVTAAALSVVGFLVAATVSARDRAGEFALLRALGLTSRQLAAWTFLEQAALIVLSIVIGTGVGLGLAAFVLPAVALTSGGGEVYPPVDVVYPWASIVAVLAVVLAGLVAAVLGINLALRRLAVARQLRVGAA